MEKFRLTLPLEETAHCDLSKLRARHTKRHMNEGTAKKGPELVRQHGVTVHHMAPTLGEPDSPKICPTTTYFKLFRWRPTCDHHVAHQPQPQSQYFSGIR